MTRRVTVLFWIAIGCLATALTLAAIGWALIGKEVWAWLT